MGYGDRDFARMKAGLCVTCGERDAIPDRNSCHKCRAKANVAARARYRAKKGIKTCHVCERGRVPEGQKICQPCQTRREHARWKRHWTKRGRLAA